MRFLIIFIIFLAILFAAGVRVKNTRKKQKEREARVAPLLGVVFPNYGEAAEVKTTINDAEWDED